VRNGKEKNEEERKKENFQRIEGEEENKKMSHAPFSHSLEKISFLCSACELKVLWVLCMVFIGSMSPSWELSFLQVFKGKFFHPGEPLEVLLYQEHKTLGSKIYIPQIPQHLGKETGVSYNS
jgi:hypothetical protein